ncbi:MurR/RpiR family transcriptional regulator [Gluconacetobacter tumulicola]
MRFARTFDFNGYSEMQALFRKKLKSRTTPYRDRVNSLHAQNGAHVGAITILDGFCRAANESLDALRHINPTSLERAIGTLAAARCIYILGLRRSMPVARYMSYLLTRLEIRHHVIGLESGMEEDTMTTATSRDAAVVISFTDYAQRTIELCSALERRRVQVVALTDSPASPVIPPSGLWLEVTEADFKGFRSNAATMVLIMALATSVAERRK